MKILVASENNAKIEGTKRAFERFFSDMDVQGISVESDVSEQPMNIEIYDGAKNRLSNLKKYARENNIEADFFVAVESGITNLLGNWEIISLAVCEDINGLESFGTSAGYPVPERYVDDILKTNIGKVINKVFNTDDKRKSKGGVSVLTKDNMTRFDLTEQAIIMCITKYINGNKWK